MQTIAVTVQSQTMGLPSQEMLSAPAKRQGGLGGEPLTACQEGGSTSIALIEVVHSNKRLITTRRNLLPSSWSCLLANVAEALGGFQILFADWAKELALSFSDHLPHGG